MSNSKSSRKAIKNTAKPLGTSRAANRRTARQQTSRKVPATIALPTEELTDAAVDAFLTTVPAETNPGRTERIRRLYKEQILTGDDEKSVAPDPISGVASVTDETEVGATSHRVQDTQKVQAPASPTNVIGERTVTKTLTLKGLSKSGKYALYAGLRTVARLSITDFPDSTPVQSFTVDGNFAGPRVPKPKLTAEQRKALPKPTLAEKIAKRQKALDKLIAQEAAQASA